MENLILVSISKEEFFNELTRRLARINHKALDTPNHKGEDYLTLSETASLLKVSKVTIHDWTNKGILIKYKIGSRAYFKRTEVSNALNKVEPRLNR